MSDSPASTALEPFRFLDLPAKIRVMMYEYIAGKHSDREMLVFDAEELRYRIPSKYDATRPQDLRTLLLVNHQVSGESLDVLYQQKTFLVILDAEHPVFNQPVDGEQYDTKNDIPYDWDMVRTVHICVGIGFFENHQTHHCSESILTLQAIEWTMLPLMKGLRTLRFFMATISEGIITAPPVHNDWIDGGGTLPHGTLYYRGMMRNLIASILDVRCGTERKKKVVVLRELQRAIIYATR